METLVAISLRHIRRVLTNLLEWVRQSAGKKIILYQNLRVGGLYPPMEGELKRLLADGYPVYESISTVWCWTV